MSDGPTMTKLLVLLAVITIIYVIFAFPLFSAAYLAFKSRDLSKLVGYFTNKLRIF